MQHFINFETFENNTSNSSVLSLVIIALIYVASSFITNPSSSEIILLAVYFVAYFP